MKSKLLKAVITFNIVLVSLLFKLASANIDLIISPFEDEGSLSSKIISRRDATNNFINRTGNSELDKATNPTYETNEKITPSASTPDYAPKYNEDKATSVCGNKDPETIKPDKHNCSNYFVSCARKISVEIASIANDKNSTSYDTLEWKRCPDGRYFDSIDSKCVKKEDAYCETYVCSELGFFPDTKNPTKFIHCQKNGIVKRLSCEPEGTIFNNDAKMCLWSTEEPTIALKVFKAFIWFIQATGVPKSLVDKNSGGKNQAYTNEDIAKIVVVAILIPLMYISVIIVTYTEIRRCGTSFPSGPYISEAEEFHRYYPRPQLRPTLANGSSGLDIIDMYPTATASSNRHSRTDDSDSSDNHYASTRL